MELRIFLFQSRRRSKYKSLIDAGADAIIASHPHIIQGCEFYNGKPIYYSLMEISILRESLLLIRGVKDWW